jgi:hypothetical protein
MTDPLTYLTKRWRELATETLALNTRLSMERILEPKTWSAMFYLMGQMGFITEQLMKTGRIKQPAEDASIRATHFMIAKAHELGVQSPAQSLAATLVGYEAERDAMPHD